MHKQKGKYFSAGGMGQRKFFFWQLHREAGTWRIRVHLEVRTSGTDLGLEQSVVVLRAVCRWPAFDPLFFSGGEAQFRDQDNSIALIAPNNKDPKRRQMVALASIPSKYLSYHKWRNQSISWQNQIYTLSFQKSSPSKENKGKGPTQGGKPCPRKSKKVILQ